MALSVDRANEAVFRLSKALVAELLPCNASTIRTISSYPRTPGPRRYLLAIGPYAIGAHGYGDPVHLVCVTDNSPATFWSYVSECLDNEDLPKRDGIIAHAAGGGGTICLHYCGISTFRQHLGAMTETQPSQEIRLKPLSTPRSVLDQLWDVRALLTSMSGNDLEVFREVYGILRVWAEASGIFCTIFGTLDADVLLWMLFRAKPASPTRDSMLKSFLTTYSTFLQVQTVRTPSGHKLYSPDRDVAADGRSGITTAMSTARDNPASLLFTSSGHFKIVSESYPSCIQISAECWAPKQRVAFQERLVAETASMFGKLRSSGALSCEWCCLWPHPFRPSEGEWMFLVFVWQEQADEGLLEAIDGHEFNIDNSIGSVGARFLCRSDYQNTISSFYVLSSPLTDSSTAEDLGPPASQPSSGKFPTASDVLSRLKWHPKHATYHYEVGYMDRFLGLIWLPLERWGYAVEEEEFIPMHRIRTVRRIGDGAVVWDRKGKVNKTG